MKTQLFTTIAAIILSPLAGFAQQSPNPPAPPVPPMPSLPGGPPPQDRHAEKRVPVTYLGVETSEVPSVVSEQLGLAKGFGLVVDYVVPDGPAASAGVQQNDILKLLNDQILMEPEQLAKLVRSYSDGTSITLTVLRKGQEQKITVKLAKKEMPQRSEYGSGRHHHSDFHLDLGDFGMTDLQDQMRDLKERLGDQQRSLVQEAVVKAREEATRAREQAMRVRDEARRAAGRINITKDDENGGLKTTNIDIGKAQIVFSDDKGELRIEKIDGKKVLTAKDPQGLLLFSGPVESKEELNKVPTEVRKRYENLEQKELPAAISSDRSDEENDSDDIEDETDETNAAIIQQISGPRLLPESAIL
ncbi:MAG TPA: PDZ domain-containing protein [Chthoniobacterales bacterium]|nr:PDZ domain-containing protein [Chthoniobacterales bacterium]